MRCSRSGRASVLAWSGYISCTPALGALQERRLLLPPGILPTPAAVLTLLVLASILAHRQPAVTLAGAKAQVRLATAAPCWPVWAAGRATVWPGASAPPALVATGPQSVTVSAGGADAQAPRR